MNNFILILLLATTYFIIIFEKIDSQTMTFSNKTLTNKTNFNQIIKQVKRNKREDIIFGTNPYMERYLKSAKKRRNNNINEHLAVNKTVNAKGAVSVIESHSEILMINTTVSVN